MTRKCQNSITGALVATTLALLASTGCAAKRPGPVRSSVSYDSPLPEKPRANFESIADKSSLAAVAAFLEQTSEFQLETKAEPPTPPPGLPTATAARETNHPLPQTISPEGPLVLQTSALMAAPSVKTVANAQVALDEQVQTTVSPALPVVGNVSIRTPKPEWTIDPVTINSSATNQSLDTQPPNVPVTLDRILSQLKKQVRENRSFDAEWQLRLTQLALTRDNEAASVSSHLPQETKSILEELIRTVSAVRTAARNPASDAGQALEQVDKLRRIMADRADPLVSRIALCRKVATFGVYEEMDATDFVAGRATQTIVYIEIRNLKSQQTDDGRFRTLLGTRIEILTADGHSVWRQEEPEVEDICARQRTDFFIAQRVTLPANLVAGDYVMKVMIEDKLSGRADEATHPFALTGALLTTSKP